MKHFDLNKFLRRSFFVCAVLHDGMLEAESSTSHKFLVFSWGIWEPEQNTHEHARTHTHTHRHTHTHSHTHTHTHTLRTPLSSTCLLLKEVCRKPLFGVSHTHTHTHARTHPHTHITNMRLHKDMLITHYVRAYTKTCGPTTCFMHTRTRPTRESNEARGGYALQLHNCLSYNTKQHKLATSDFFCRGGVLR